MKSIFYFDKEPVSELRRDENKELEEPLVHKLGWAFATVDPNVLLKRFKSLKLKNGYVLRVALNNQQFGRYGAVAAMPQNVEWLEEHLSQDSSRPDLPEGATYDFMSLIEGDGTPWSFMSASIFKREVQSLGSFWHGCQWNMNRVLFKEFWEIPPEVVEPKPKIQIHFTCKDKSRWTLLNEFPDDWRPHVIMDEDEIQVVFLIYSGFDTESIIRITDVYTASSYLFATQEQTMGKGVYGINW